MAVQRSCMHTLNLLNEGETGNEVMHREVGTHTAI